MLKLMQGCVSVCWEHTCKHAGKQLSKNTRVFIFLTVTVVQGQC